MPREYHGPRFSVEQRKAMRAKAWDLRQGTDMKIRDIAQLLDVSHTTVVYWLQAEKRAREGK